MKNIRASVIYYSRTGTTKKVAEVIREKLQCEIEAIISEGNRTGFFGFMRCCFEILFKKTPAIKEMEIDPNCYDIVIIGTPVWAGTLSSPVRTFLKKYNTHFKKIAFFCTRQSSEDGKVFKDMTSLCGKEPLAVLELQESDVKAGNYSEKVKDFINKIILDVKEK